jgi:hypothetical protein
VLIHYVLYATGITGFETASNYVEEMRDPGVFVTTVSWLWYALWWFFCCACVAMCTDMRRPDHLAGMLNIATY